MSQAYYNISEHELAMDYADEEPKMENLAVKFKLVETKDEFKKIFEECQAKLGSTPTATPKKDEAAKVSFQNILTTMEVFNKLFSF